MKEVSYLGYRFRKGGAGSICGGESEKGDGDNGTGVRDREKEVWGGLEEENEDL